MCLRVSPSESGSSGILFIGFNQDYGCFAVGLQNGFRIFNSDPLKQLDRYEFDVRDGTGVGYLEMLYRTNLLGILGGGHHARLPSNVACLWDGKEQQFLLEISCFSEVKALRLSRDRIVVVLADAVKVYTCGRYPTLVYESGTCRNPLGLCHVCQAEDNPLIAFPSKRLGSVHLVNVGDVQTSIPSTSVSPNPSSTGANNIPPRQLIAHENALAAIQMNTPGTLLATCSVRGTLIRVFSTKDCQLIHELRRGINPAVITSVSFNATSELLCVTSERGTAHVFCLTKDNRINTKSRSSTSAPSGSVRDRDMISIHTSEVRCVLETKSRAICAFSPLSSNILIVLAADGSFYKYSFTPNGTVTRVAFVNFLDFYEDEADF